MTEASKSSQFRIAFALVCGLALCCAVMYITADGNDEIIAEYTNLKSKVQASEMHTETSDLAAVKGLRAANTATATATGTEIKTESWDVKKVGTIYTDDTPDGRVKLLDYFQKVEKQIATEVAGRKTDIENIRIQMAKNRAYNAKARSKMKKMLLARMAVNAKRAKDDLDHQMHIVATEFAAAAKLENERNKANKARSRKTREIMRKNKKENTHQLHMAVLNQQRALSALDAKTNAKIKKTNANIGANAAQIKANAIKARQDLDHQMEAFDQKMYNVNKEAEEGRSALAVEAKAMDKKLRAMVTGKVRKITAETAKQFSDVRKTMAADRAHEDAMLAHTSMRMMTALNAQRALQDARFKQTVADIAAAKKEADEKIAKMKQGFKMQIVSLASTVKEHVGKLNSRVTTLQGTVTNNKLEQAKVNKAVHEEIQNMIKIGNDHEAAISKSDAALHAVMAANREKNEAEMTKMSNQFYAAVEKIRAEAAKDRKYQETRLTKTTGALFATLAKNKEAQDQVNKELSAATKAAADEARRALTEAKHDFSTRLGALHTTVVKNDKKATKKIEDLAGVVEANAAKDLAGRKMLKSLSKSNALELKAAVRDAVQAGEKRAREVEKMAKQMNKKTRDALNARISTEIGALTKKIHSDIEGLQLQTKEARAQMKAEILTSLREQEEILKDQLAETVKWSNTKFVELNEQLATTEKEGAEGRAALKASQDAQRQKMHAAIKDAIEAQAKNLMALKYELGGEIKKTNSKADAYGEQVKKYGEEVKATMASNVATMKAKIDAAKKAAKKQLAAAEATSLANHEAAMDEINQSLDEAKEAEDKKFDSLYIKMGEDRAAFEEALAADVTTLNTKLAKHAALEDARFSKTVKDLAAAKKKAYEEVQAAKKEFTVGLNVITASVKQIESHMVGEIGIIATTVFSESARQARINQKVEEEMERIVDLSDKYESENKRARAAIRELMDKNKAVAAQEVKDLKASATAKIAKTRGYQAKLLRDAKHDLTDATTLLYEKLAADKAEQDAAILGLTKELSVSQASTSAALDDAKKSFTERMATLVNTASAHHKEYEEGMEELTGVVYDWKKASAEDRELIRQEAKAMEADLNKAIAKAVQIGEAKAKEVLEGSMSHIDATRMALQIEISAQVEHMANVVLKTVLEDRSTIANNYLSVKGYAGASQDAILNYIQKGNGKGLLSIGDFLQTVAIQADVDTEPTLGVSAGLGEIQPAFGGDIIPDTTDITKVNGLVDEFYNVYGEVASRWSAGLGKYMLGKMAQAMTKEGILSVGKVPGHSGQHVYVNGQTLGLESQMEGFVSIACRVTHYQDFLTKLNAKLPKKSSTKPFSVPPPEWPGN